MAEPMAPILEVRALFTFVNTEGIKFNYKALQGKINYGIHPNRIVIDEFVILLAYLSFYE
jgi:hypothetical protein